VKIQKGMKYRIYPNKEQQQKLAIQFGHARFAYNSTLANRKSHYKKTGKGLSAFDSMKLITSAKLATDTLWLTQADSQVLQQKTRDVETAYKNFFKGLAGYPNFKRKHDVQSIRYPQRVKFNDNKTYLPKVGHVKTVFHRPLEGKQKSTTVSKTKTGKYFVAVLCEIELDIKVHEGPSVGIDLGLKDFYITSEGTKVAHPKLLKKSEREVKIAQRKLSKKRKGSANRNKARLRLALKHERLANSRKDFLHKQSAFLTSKYSFIGTESLRVRNMMRNHCLAKSIGDSGWSEFVRQLGYKSAWKGGTVFKIGTFFPSSKTCNNCGYINNNLKLSDRNWLCPECQTTLDRDINAALNILKEATAGTAEC